MKIAILSDAHDDVANTKQAVTQAMKLGAETLFFCGDFCSPGVGMALSEFKGPIYAVFGNNDGDKLHLVKYTTGERSDVTFFGEADAFFELDGRKIAMTHYPRYAIPLAKTGDYDLVCFGHDHKPRVEVHGECLAVNPGTLHVNSYRKTVLGFALYDTKTHQAQLIPLE